MSFNRPDHQHDTTNVRVNKLFNMIQACRVDAQIMRNSKETCKASTNLIKSAEALVRELKSIT